MIFVVVLVVVVAVFDVLLLASLAAVLLAVLAVLAAPAAALIAAAPVAHAAVLVCWLRRAGRTKAGRCGHGYGGRAFVLRQAGDKAHVRQNEVYEPKPQCLRGMS